MGFLNRKINEVEICRNPVTDNETIAINKTSVSKRAKQEIIIGISNAIVLINFKSFIIFFTFKLSEKNESFD